MTEYGRAAVLREPRGRLHLTEYPVPEVVAGAALIRVSLANVCGSDLHIWRGELDPRKRSWALPKHMGHEMTGRIAALGEGVTTDSDGQPLVVGDRVVYRYFFPCGRCRNCLSDYSRPAHVGTNRSPVRRTTGPTLKAPSATTSTCIPVTSCSRCPTRCLTTWSSA